MKRPASTDKHIDPMELNEFMNSLQRLFKIGIYYPSGHVILDKATDRLMHQINDVAGDSDEVVLRVFNNTIILQDIQLDSEQPFVGEFNTLLSTLGVASITIAKQATMQELHDFVKKMLAYKAKVLNAKQFTQVEVTDLPHTISVEKLEFLARDKGSSSGDTDSAENLSAFIESLQNYGLSSDEILQCKALLDSLPQRLTKSDMDLGDLPYATWDDVANLLAKAIRGDQGVDETGKITFRSQSNINALASILKKLELSTSDKKSRAAINLLVRIIKKPGSHVLEENDEAEKENFLNQRSFPERPTIDVDKIQEFTDSQKISPSVLAKISDSTRDTECLSILLQLMRHEQPIANQIRMQQMIRETLSGKMSEKTWEIMSCGLHTIAQDGDPKRLASAIKLISEPLRQSKYGNTLKLFQHTLKICKERESRFLWPFVVNELLVEGSSKDKIVFHQLCQYAARLPNDHMVARLAQLKNLESFQEHKIASDIFHAVSPSCYALFAFLLKTDIERYVGERVIGGLKRNPRDWLIKGVAPMLNLTNQEHKLFLYSYLRQASQKHISETIKKIAIKIITETIPELPQERRSEQWVENSISATAQLPSDAIREMLQQIAGGKKLLFIPEWPNSCRKAAAQALSKMKGK